MISMEDRERFITAYTLANNHVVIETDCRRAFFSYGTLIAEYRLATEELYLTAYWDYSKTTSKYLYKFIDSLPTYYNIHDRADIREALKSSKIGMIYGVTLQKRYS